MIGITVLPPAVGAGAEWRTIEKGPKGMVTSAEPPVRARADADGVGSDDAPGIWTEIGGVGVGVTVTRFCALTKGVTMVEASGPNVRLGGTTDA
jgi:hypothetical protein